MSIAEIIHAVRELSRSEKFQIRRSCLTTWPKRNCWQGLRKHMSFRSTHQSMPPMLRPNWPRPSWRKGPAFESCRAVSLPRPEPGFRWARLDAGPSDCPSSSVPFAAGSGIG